MSHCLEGLRYFQTYDWLFLRSVVTAGYIGWCVFCLEFVIRSFVLGHQSQTSLSIKSCLAVSIAACQYVSIHLRTARLIFFPWSSWVVCTPCCGSRKCRQCTMPMSCSLCISGTKSYATIAPCLKLYVLVFKMALSSLLLSSLQHLSFWRPWCLASFTVKCWQLSLFCYLLGHWSCHQEFALKTNCCLLAGLSLVFALASLPCCPLKRAKISTWCKCVKCVWFLFSVVVSNLTFCVSV